MLDVMGTANSGDTARRTELDEEMMVALRTYVGSVETYIGAASEAQHLHRTDLNALSIVMDQAHHGHVVTPGVLSRTMSLSASATTSMIDRLEKAGHVVRSAHPEDRRSVMIELTSYAEETGDRLFQPLAQATGAVFDAYRDEQMRFIIEFLNQLSTAATQVTERMTLSP